MSGHFSGWVEEGVRQQLGLCASAAVRTLLLRQLTLG